jgi:hypothetical protein
MLFYDAWLKELMTSKPKRGLRHEMTPDALELRDVPSGLSQPARRALVGAGYRRLEHLTSVTEVELK